MLRADLVASYFLYRFLGPIHESALAPVSKAARLIDSHITQCHHADSLPNAQTDSWSDAAI